MASPPANVPRAPVRTLGSRQGLRGNTVRGTVTGRSGSYPSSAPPVMAGSHTSGSQPRKASTRDSITASVEWSAVTPPHGDGCAAISARTCSRDGSVALNARMASRTLGKSFGAGARFEVLLEEEVQRRIFAQCPTHELRR